MLRKIIVSAMMLFVTSVVPAQVGESQKDDQGKQGIASWYGGKHHGRKMANGKKFDMYAMTAAHRTYPLGTELCVTNPKNNKSVKVKITDRGPYSKKREIDLSKGAFSKIGDTKKGLLKVHIKVL